MTITATTADGDRTDTCVVDIKTGVRSFTVTGSYQKYYEPNDPLNLDGVTLDVVYADNSAPGTAIPVTTAMVTPLPFNWNILTTTGSTVAGNETHVIPIRYGGATGNLKVTIRTPKYATIIGTPVRTVYGSGAPLTEVDLRGLEVVVFYETGENRIIPATSPEIVNTATLANFSSTEGLASGDIGPLSYKNIVTTGISGNQLDNMSTLNGRAKLLVDISPIVVKIGDKYSTVGTPTAGLPLLETVIGSLLPGTTAEITLYNNTVGAVSAAGVTMALPPKSNITLLANGAQRTITSLGTATMPVFTVSAGATLTVGDNILVTSGATPAASSVVVSGAGSKFTMKDGSAITQVAASTATSGFLNVKNGAEAVIERGATVTIPTGVTAATTATAASGILVESGGTLTLGGNIGTTGTPGGVGDLVIDGGTLVLDGTAEVGRLALVTSGLFSNPVILNSNWYSTPGLTLNLVGVGPAGPPFTIITAPVSGWYNNKPIFKGPGTNGTVTDDQMLKVALGNFFYNGTTLNVSILDTTGNGGLGTSATLLANPAASPPVPAGVLR